MDKPVTYCMSCGVPNHLHGTCCGWTNANMILLATNDLELQWKAIQEVAYRQLYGHNMPAIASTPYTDPTIASSPYMDPNVNVLNTGFVRQEVVVTGITASETKY